MLCEWCNKEITYSSSPGQLAAHKAKKRFCSSWCQTLNWRKENPKLYRMIKWKAMAKQRNIPFTITEDDLDWPEYCPLLGTKLNYLSQSNKDTTASLDKIIPELGYIPGNVQIISSRANTMKNDASMDELITFARNVIKLYANN